MSTTFFIFLIICKLYNLIIQNRRSQHSKFSEHSERKKEGRTNLAKKENTTPVTTEAIVDGENVKAEVTMNAPVTPIDLKEQKKEYNRLIGLIKKEYKKVETSSLGIAFALHQIYKEELFRIEGFKNISECGEEHFNLGKTSVNAFINVIERFAKVDENGNTIYGNEQGICEQFEKFTWSKLCLLTSVPEEYLDQFDSTMTAKQIRDKKGEIAKLISNNDEPKLIEDAEAPKTTDIVEQTEAEADTEVEADDREEMAKKCLLPLFSCSTMAEFKALLENKELLLAIEMQIDKLEKGITKDKVPHIEIMFTYID